MLKVLAIEFTDTVPTLAVTCEAQPRLLVNLAFVGEHCRTDAEVKAVICHEFLHVLLRHTERFTMLTPAEHLALDAVINAIIHRSLGPDYSGMMSRYYAEERGIAAAAAADRRGTGAHSNAEWGGGRSRDRQVQVAWGGLYAGQLVADDIRDLARDHLTRKKRPAAALLGNHDALGGGNSPGAETLSRPDGRDRCRAQGHERLGHVSQPDRAGVGADAYRNEVRAADAGLTRWRRETYAVLRRHLLPDPRSVAREPSPRSFTLPVLSPGDRRAALRALWSPFLPEARWDRPSSPLAPGRPRSISTSAAR